MLRVGFHQTGLSGQLRSVRLLRELYILTLRKIVEDDLEELSIETRPVEPDTHFTEVALSNPHKPLQGRTIGKIQEHLASIYRVFIRDGSLELRFRGEELSFSEPETLCAPFYKSESESPQLWRKEIDFDFGAGLRAHGFAALRATAEYVKGGIRPVSQKTTYSRKCR